LLRVVGGISALSLEIRMIKIPPDSIKNRDAAHSAVSPEIRFISWKFKSSAEFSDFLQIFYFSSGRFVFPAGEIFSQLIF
jgi:hypothetical protein